MVNSLSLPISGLRFLRAGQAVNFCRPETNFSLATTPSSSFTSVMQRYENFIAVYEFFRGHLRSRSRRSFSFWDVSFHHYNNKYIYLYYSADFDISKSLLTLMTNDLMTTILSHRIIDWALQRIFEGGGGKSVFTVEADLGIVLPGIADLDG